MRPYVSVAESLPPDLDGSSIMLSAEPYTRIPFEEWRSTYMNWKQQARILHIPHPWLLDVTQSTDMRQVQLEAMYAFRVSYADWVQDLAATFFKRRNDSNMDSCIHLRLEADMRTAMRGRVIEGCEGDLNFFQALDLAISRGSSVFIAAGSGVPQWVLDKLGLQFRLVNKSHHLTAEEIPVHREFAAALDDILCGKAKSFVGFSCSTFSEALYWSFVKEEKPAFLLECCIQVQL